MAQRGSGLRNRNRQGTGTYAEAHKSRSADSYGRYVNGKCIVKDSIAGSPLDATQLPETGKRQDA